MQFDFIVIGSGLAGLTSALVLKDFGTVLLVSKSSLSDTATNLAQGGINAVVDPSDSFGSHIEDTLIAGVYHNKKSAVEYMVKHSPQAIDWLLAQGVRFDRENGKLAPTKEAAHSHNRVLHATDFTGQEIERALVEKAKESKNILVWEHCFTVDLLHHEGVCFGVQVIKENKVQNIFSRAVILATGGLGQIYRYTTNPNVATGDGIAMGVRAGCSVADLEFVQFHPTALQYDESPLFLLSEALRGEGAHLIKIKNNEESERFMPKVDPRGELAPRDIVARAIFAEQKKGYQVFLDIRHRGEEFIKKRFPNISKALRKRGFDLVRDVVPVTPAAHYSCGGLTTDLYGRTNIVNLFAFGEVAYTGVQGANRLASNSLLEAVVFPLRLPKVISLLGPAARVSQADASIRSRKSSLSPYRLSRSLSFGEASLGNPSLASPKLSQYHEMRTRLQRLMWEKVGIVRKTSELKETLTQIKEWEKSLSKVKEINPPLMELKNMLLVSELVAKSALARKKSIGAHFILP